MPLGQNWAEISWFVTDLMKKLVSHVLFWNLDKSLLIFWIIGSEMNWLFLYIKHILEWQQWQKDAFWATWDHYWVCLIVVNPLAQFNVAVITKCVICEIGVVLSVVLCISYSWNWKVKACDFKTLTLHWYFLVAIFIMSQSWPTLQSLSLLYLAFVFHKYSSSSLSCLVPAGVLMLALLRVPAEDEARLVLRPHNLSPQSCIFTLICRNRYLRTSWT